jgi:hypothetical protein
MNKTDSIAIVGAGPAGLHMAYLLREAGYTKIDLYEKRSVIGGRVRTEKGNRTLHELGACWTAPNYHCVHDLMRKFGMKMPHMAGATGRRTLIRPAGEAAPGANFRILSSIVRYIWNHHESFGKYQEAGVLHWKNIPKKVLSLWAMPLEQYLKKMNLLALREPFAMILSTQGYGYLESVPTYYAFYWITPTILLSYRFYLMENFLSLVPENLQAMVSKLADHLFTTIHPLVSAIPLIVPEGFLTLFSHLEKYLIKRGVKIYKNREVKEIQRANGQIHIATGKAAASYQHLFLAIPWKEVGRIVKNPTPWESKMIKATKTYTMITALIKAKTTSKSYTDSSVTWVHALEEKNQGHLISLRHSKSALNRSHVPIHGKLKQEYVTYQILDHPISPSRVAHLQKMLLQDLKECAFLKDIEICQYNVYPEYHQHQVGADLALLKERDANQGKNNTYHIGAGVCFDSILSIFDHNLYLYSLKWK